MKCSQIGARQFYGGRLVCLAGVQTKVEVSETWACPEHWATFQRMQEEARKRVAIRENA